MTSVHNIPVTTISGSNTTLGEFAGSVMLVVNVASQCGLTPQYEALESLHQTYKDKGFSVLGFPANNFGAQEPGTDAEIAEFCSTKFDVKFPMFSKISVVGDDQHPLYSALTAAAPRAEGDDPDVLWNFEKFLVNRQGEVVKRFAPTTTPDDAALTSAIEAELAK
ncbi:MAG: glutathione peroxidase [Actinobacteria bacterium]|nr:glutathione peroxidase [Actinomycetota bacterium]